MIKKMVFENGVVYEYDSESAPSIDGRSPTFYAEVISPGDGNLRLFSFPQDFSIVPAADDWYKLCGKHNVRQSKIYNLLREYILDGNCRMISDAVKKLQHDETIFYATKAGYKIKEFKIDHVDIRTNRFQRGIILDIYATHDDYTSFIQVMPMNTDLPLCLNSQIGGEHGMAYFNIEDAKSFLLKHLGADLDKLRKKVLQKKMEILRVQSIA